MRIAAICPCLLAGACFAASRVYDAPGPSPILRASSANFFLTAAQNARIWYNYASV